MAGVQRARFQTTYAAVADGYQEAAERWFGLGEDALAAKLGRFTKGKHVGKVRGWMVWCKCVEGGWAHGKGVVRPGIIHAMFCETYDDMIHKQQLPAAEFWAWSTRVDTCYGYNPAEARRLREISQLVDAATLHWPIVEHWTPEQEAALEKWVAMIVPDADHAKHANLREDVKRSLKQHCIDREMDAYEIEQTTRLSPNYVQRVAQPVAG